MQASRSEPMFCCVQNPAVKNNREKYRTALHGLYTDGTRTLHGRIANVPRPALRNCTGGDTARRHVSSNIEKRSLFVFPPTRFAVVALVSGCRANDDVITVVYQLLHTFFSSGNIECSGEVIPSCQNRIREISLGR